MRASLLVGCGRFILPLLAISALMAADSKPSGEKLSLNYEIPLWEESKVPLAKGNGPLDKPFLTVFLPPEGKRNSASIVVAPGGGNIMLMYGSEGMEIAERYNEWGVTAFVLTYRLSPRYGNDARVLDAKRAIQLVRYRASQFQLDPAKVGFIGFSAGSTLGHQLAAAAGPGDANAADPVDRLSSRPDYLGLVYGPGRVAPGESLKNWPPTFLLSAQADTGNAVGSAQLFAELTRAGVTAEIHVYQKGRHGFGSAFATPIYSDWMGRLQRFLQNGGFLPGSN
jgi:endo-1,4-beta-xylanase